MRALLPSLVARPLLTAVCFLALCAPAGAQTFAEAPSQLVFGDAECVAPTGAPGELAVGGEGETKLLHATPAGFTAAPSVPLNDCPVVATRPNGAGVAAAGGVTIDGALRDPGGAWRNVPIAGAGTEMSRYGSAQAAIADSGHAIVAWIEAEGFGGDDRFKVRVARRAPGGGFGAPELVGPSQTERPRDFEVGIADNGDAFVLLWGSDDNLPPYNLRVTVASAPAGATFQAPTDLGAVPWRSSPSLAVAPDGRALVAFPDGQSLKVAERAPGESFKAAAPVVPATDLTGVRTRAAIGTGGRAALAWQGTSLGRTELITRAGVGAFSAPVTLAPGGKPSADFDPFYTSEWYDALTGIGDILSGTWINLALTPDGRALLTTNYYARNERTLYGAALFTVALGSTQQLRQTAGDGLQRPAAPVPLTFADGTPAVAWAEAVRLSTRGREIRLHLAGAGATAAAKGPVPRVTVGKPRNRVLKGNDGFNLPITCSAACQVHVQVAGGDGSGSLELERAGSGRLYVSHGWRPFAKLRSSPIRFALSYAGRDTQRPRTRIFTLRLKRTPEAPVPHPRDLRAVRQGDRIKVTWRSTGPQPPDDDYTTFWVSGSPTRAWSEPLEVRNTDDQRGKGPKFAITLTRGTQDIRFVTLRASHVGSSAEDDTMTVAVR